MIDFKKELNPAQYRVVTSGDGPALVLAGAGSGKTRTLVYRVAYLVEKGVKPERILLLTFTNKAAHEMLSRVEELLGERKLSGKVWGGTFHHVANILLHRMGNAVGIPRNYTILDREDSRDVVKRVIKEVAGSGAKRRLPQPGIFVEVLSYAANAQTSIADALMFKYPEGVALLPIFERVAQQYELKKRATRSLDFDDLLSYWLKLLKIPRIQKKLSGLWDYILVDEYQDTNVVQDAIVRLLADPHRNVLVVGDDAQSIYSFRAANIGNILQFPTHYPDATTYRLEQNYRSTPEILDVANEVIARNVKQFKKVLFTGVDSFIKPELVLPQDPEEEAVFIADRIMALEDEGERLSNIAVLFRAAYQSQPLELELNTRKIPYEMRGGLRFFERAHIKDILAYVRLLVNAQDEWAWYRVLQMYEGIGDATANAIIRSVMPLGEWSVILKADFTVRGSGQKSWEQCGKLLRNAHEHRERGTASVIRMLESSYRTYARLQYIDYEDRLADIEQLALFAEHYTDIESFVSETSLQEAYVIRGEAKRKQEPAVVLSTIHQAKGLEWNTVFIIHLTSTSIPHPLALHEEGGLEEERRLFYVAITRARRRLYLNCPLSASRHSLTLFRPSQFLHEIDPQLVTGARELENDESYITIGDDGEREYLPRVNDW